MYYISGENLWSACLNQACYFLKRIISVYLTETVYQLLRKIIPINGVKTFYQEMPLFISWVNAITDLIKETVPSAGLKQYTICCEKVSIKIKRIKKVSSSCRVKTFCHLFKVAFSSAGLKQYPISPV